MPAWAPIRDFADGGSVDWIPPSCGSGVDELSTPDGGGAPVAMGKEVLILEISGSGGIVDRIVCICDMEPNTVDVEASAGGTEMVVDVDVDVELGGVDGAEVDSVVAS